MPQPVDPSDLPHQTGPIQPDPYATWDPSIATDDPDGLPDKAIVPLVESLRSRGIVTLQSCVGHAGTDDGTLWVRADTVDGAYIRLFLLPSQQRREVFHRVQFVHWPEPRWEFIWPPEHADAAMAALDGLVAADAPEPATPPAQPVSVVTEDGYDTSPPPEFTAKAEALAEALWGKYPTGLQVLDAGTMLAGLDRATVTHGDYPEDLWLHPCGHVEVAGVASNDRCEGSDCRDPEAPWRPLWAGPEVCMRCDGHGDIVDGSGGATECPRCSGTGDRPEPSPDYTPPAQQPHDAPAGDGGHPGTPDGPAVLGRALLYANGSVGRIVDEGVDAWRRAHPNAKPFLRPSREVLLVRPEVGRVLEAAQAWRQAGRLLTGGAADYQAFLTASAAYHRYVGELADAWDALFASEPGRSSTADVADGLTSTSAAEGCLTTNQRTTGGPGKTLRIREPAPEPAGDDPAALVQLLREMRDQHLDGYADRVEQLVQVAIDVGAELVAEEQETVDRLRADHLLIPKAAIVGYRVRAGYVPGIMIPPDSVEMVLRGDLGQEGDRG